MAHRVGEAKPLISNKRVITGLVLGTLIFFGGTIFSSCNSVKFGKAPVENFQPRIETKEIQLHSENWSEWIQLQVGDKWQLDAPGWVEYQFWDGTIRRFADKKAQWLGTVKSGTFKLRGAAGTAKLTVEK